MTVYLPGQRIVLIHTSDPHTRLRPGALGTVRSHDQQTNTVAIGWDDGSTLAMLLDDGDQIALADTPPSAAEDSTGHPVGETGEVGPDAPASTEDGQIAYVTELPPCGIHQLRNVEVPAAYDAALHLGGWAYVCESCFRVYGVGLGIGRGQRLIVGRRPGEAPSAADA